MERFNYSSEKYDEKNIDVRILKKLIDEHTGMAAKFLQNEDYYRGKHKILSRERKMNGPNNKITCNHARYIADVATGYFMGNPISYTSEEDIGELTDAFDKANVDKADNENAENMAKYGLSYEYIFAKEGKSELSVKVLDPKNVFMVYDDSITEEELFAVYYYEMKDDSDDKSKYHIYVFTKNYVYEYIGSNKGNAVLESEERHNLGEIPIIEYLNNSDAVGDFELQIPLIDAYNSLVSDRINDKEQFLDAILVLYGAEISDDTEGNEAIKRLREERLLEMANGTKAEYLTNTFDENGVEVLRKALENDIHKFSYVPCLTDENFAGNASGVAMEYKLIGLEMITKIKTRFYRNGLRKRIKIFCNFLGKKGRNIKYEGIIPVFSRGLPKNITELAQMVSDLNGVVSQRTLLNQLPFVEDADTEIERIDKEKESETKRQKELFVTRDNEPIGDEDEQ